MSLGDLIFQGGQWLRTTPMTPLSLGIQKTWLSNQITGHFWAVPMIQTVHILAIATVFGSVVMVNLRIFQAAGRSRTMTQTVRRFLPWIWWGLLTLLISGIGMVFGDPVRNLTNPVFWTKMVSVSLAALISLAFQESVRRNVARWELTHSGRVGIRIASGCVVALWVFIIFCGRWIAYAPT
jgi:uncharacterized membrane protein SirB2